MRRALAMTLGGVALAACIGGQSAQMRAQSDALGDRSGAVPEATLRERDWTNAATGHGAAGPIPDDVLARMEARSAPGGDRGAAAPDRDGGPPAAHRP